MKHALAIASLIGLASPAHAFVDLGFVNIPGQSVGYQARIHEFSDPVPPLDYWFVSQTPLTATSFRHDFNGIDYYLTRADTIKFARFTPPVPGVPEPSTWAMLLIGFIAMAIAFRKRRPQGRFTVRAL